MSENIKRRFHKEMLAIYHNVGREIGYWAYRYLKLVKRRRGVAAAKYFLRKPTISEGFTRLKKIKRLKFSVEALVLRRPWSQLARQTHLLNMPRLKERLVIW